MITNKTFLITGGAGFIGINLTTLLLLNNNKVICVDNFDSSSIYKVQQFCDNPNYTLIIDDVRNFTVTECEEKLDYIVNLACIASPKRYFKKPIETLFTSIQGIKNLLDIANKNNCVILQSSTSEVYGNPNCPIQSEDYNGNVSCIGKRSCYDEGKRAAETLMFDYNRLYGTKIKVIRIFNTYGEWMDYDDGRVISNFIWQALNNQDITIHDSGLQTRSYQYISDLLDGMIKMLESDDSIIGPINLGNPEEHTVKETADIVLKHIDTKSKLIYTKGYDDDPQKRKPCIDKAKELLGWCPKVSFEEGLKRTIEYFKIVKGEE